MTELLAAREMGLLEPSERAELERLIAQDGGSRQVDVAIAQSLVRDALRGETVPDPALRALHERARERITPRLRHASRSRSLAAIAAALAVTSGVLALVLLRTSSDLEEARRRERDAMSAIMLDPRANQRLLDRTGDTRQATLTRSGTALATVRWSSSLQRGVLGVSMSEPTDPSRERLAVTLIASDGSRALAASVPYAPVYSDAKQSEAIFILAPAHAVHDAEAIELAIETVDGSSRRVLATARLR